MEKYVVPGGMARAAFDAMDEHAVDHRIVGCVPGSMCSLTCGLEAALKWLAENPIEPTEKDKRELDHEWHSKQADKPTSFWEWAFSAMQSRMFLAPEPEVPNSISTAIRSATLTPEQGERIIEMVRMCVRHGVRQ